MIYKVIRGRLSGATSASSRVYPLILPQQATLPAVTYSTISDITTHAFNQDATIKVARVQVDCWALTYLESQTLANEVATLLSRYIGTVSGVNVQDITLQSQQDIYESDTAHYRASQDYMIFIEV
jgi:hypothetical protein